MGRNKLDRLFLDNRRLKGHGSTGTALRTTEHRYHQIDRLITERTPRTSIASIPYDIVVQILEMGSHMDAISLGFTCVKLYKLKIRLTQPITRRDFSTSQSAPYSPPLSCYFGATPLK